MGGPNYNTCGCACAVHKRFHGSKSASCIMQRPMIRLLQLRHVPVLQQLRLEEALLRNDARNWCITNSGSDPPVVVMGISGKPERLLDLDRVQRDGVPVIRRYSGGGTVVVDRNTHYVSFICNAVSGEEGGGGIVWRWLCGGMTMPARAPTRAMWMCPTQAHAASWPGRARCTPPPSSTTRRMQCARAPSFPHLYRC